MPQLRTEVTLVKNGNSVCLNIPRPLRAYLGWLTGERIILELTEDGKLIARRFTPEDVPTPGHSRVVYDFTDPTDR